MASFIEVIYPADILARRDVEDEDICSSLTPGELEVWSYLVNLGMPAGSARAQDIVPENSPSTPDYNIFSQFTSFGNELEDNTESLALPQADGMELLYETSLNATATVAPTVLDSAHPASSEHGVSLLATGQNTEAESSTSLPRAHSHDLPSDVTESNPDFPQATHLFSPPSSSFSMPIPKCLWCGTDRQLDCCEWSILKASAVNHRPTLRRTSSERVPGLPSGSRWKKLNLSKSASSTAIAGLVGSEGKGSGIEKDRPMAALQRILSGKF